jgi:hypothetical protein
MRGSRIGSERGEFTANGWWIIAVVAGVLMAIPWVIQLRAEGEGAEAGVDAIAQVNDTQAQLAITNAIRAAQEHFAETATLSDWTPQLAQGFDPAMTYNTAPTAGAGVVSMRVAGPDGVVFVTMGGSGPLCAALRGDIVTYGHADAASPDACADPQW